MLADIAQAIAEVVLQVIVEFLFYWVGKLTVAVFTLGCVQCDCYDRESTWRGSWRIIGRDSEGAYLTAEFTSLIGFFAIVASIIAFLHLR